MSWSNYFTIVQVIVDGCTKRYNRDVSFTTEELNRSWLENMRQFYMEELFLGNVNITKSTPNELVVEYDGEYGHTTRVYKIGKE